MNKFSIILICAAAFSVTNANAAKDIFQAPEKKDDAQGEQFCKTIITSYDFIEYKVNPLIASGYEVKGFAAATDAGRGYVILMCKKK